MSDDKITLEIDGRVCTAAPGEMIIAVADREGIVIPRFCYHEKLSIAANCRMCLVEAEQGGRPFPKPIPACATPVGEGMKVLTRSKKALDAQRGTMEFLLINHPLDCPICDQGGECELQDVSMGYGEDVSRFSERKRVVKDEDLGPLIATEMTRCIHCTRCVRFGAEIAGLRELGATGRGEDMRIGTFVGQSMAHELSGNIIDLCPVGALTSKPYRFTARAWELTSDEGIAPHDGVGSNLQLHIRDGKVMRVHPRDHEAVNECWISDRDRFSYEGLNSPERLTAPMLKRDGEWQEVDWQEALHAAVDLLKAPGPDQLGVLVSPTATLEEQFLLQRLVRALGSDHIDTRLRQLDFSAAAADPRLPWLGVPIAELEQQQAAFLIGSDIRQEQPLLAHRLRKAALSGATIALLNPYEVDLNHRSIQLTTTPQALGHELRAILKVLGKPAAGPIADPDERHQRIADALTRAGQAGKGLVLLGALAESAPAYGLVRALAAEVAAAAGCQLGFLSPAANSVGSWCAGSLPHRLPGGAAPARPGLDARAMLTDPRQGYLLWGLEPDRDLADPTLAMSALLAAKQVVACAAFRSPALDAVADVLLPISAFAETAGTFVNTEARWQRFQGAVPPPGDARPGWKVLRVLGTMMELPGFAQNSAREVHDELASQCRDLTPDSQMREAIQASDRSSAAPQAAELFRLGNVPIYATDPLVRRASALQRTPLAEQLAVSLHPDDAAALGLADGQLAQVAQVATNGERTEVNAPVVIDDRIAVGCARIPAGVEGSGELGPIMGPVQISKAVA
ncbi:NADH-quinone oxidoreductase subunit NuoG [Lamprobacter modestohalophilus]|uniref:NADH-quinone oxidoreductase subunit NuoG n=1 Tax=Lamprobacter modestohalophilus TaxID=1064514 RepID=UPI002ADED27F|nr:NADH-quinone oxidoreductase subunit NuoG [Lamprobacter modestohalophilus]MEA1050306.1 NADH-quinone oxidoreductase subunit NuoG [Lamprobacter modestohalophilus]